MEFLTKNKTVSALITMTKLNAAQENLIKQSLASLFSSVILDQDQECQCQDNQDQVER